MVTLYEAVGPASDERPAISLTLANDDVHSSVTSQLKYNTDGQPVVSCERWVRLHISPPFCQISALRYWLEDYSINPDWVLRAGVTNTYVQPSKARSSYAIDPVPSGDPGELHANWLPALTSGPSGFWSPWLVIQATAVGRLAGELQATPVYLRYDWREV